MSTPRIVVRFGRPRPAFAPGPGVPLVLRIATGPESHVRGEYMPIETIQALARARQEARERA